MDVSEMDEKLYQICKHAACQVKYYQQIFNEYELIDDSIKSVEDLQKIPMLTQQVVQQNMEKLLGDTYQKYPEIDKLIVHRSRG